jgi:arginine decarboxylase
MMNEKKKTDQIETPLVSAISKHIKHNNTPFHVPGHMGGRCLPEEINELIGENIFKSDLTEIANLDNLHKPAGVIKKAQKLLSDAYGVLESFFLVGGSTAGIKAMMLSILNPGDKIIIGRDSHKSVISGLILGGFEPVFIDVENNNSINISNPISIPETIQTISNNKSAKAILITSPNYFGTTADIQTISKSARENSIKILVDGAHGAHFSFHPKLPKSAVSLDVDMAVHSAHKTLPALTQGSYLHLVSKNINISRLQSVLAMVQTSSPSYPIMATLDACRKFMVWGGEEYLTRTLEISEWLRYEINGIDGLFVPSRIQVKDGGAFDFDETKLIIDVTGLGYTGYEFEKKLQENGIQIELATVSVVLCVLTVATSWESAKKLLSALKNIPRIKSESKFLTNLIQPKPRLKLLPREAFFSADELIPLKKSAGRISSETICPYPPGIPVLIPGEEVSREMIEYLIELQNNGASITGIKDSNISVVK